MTISSKPNLDKIAIIVSQFNEEVTSSLLKSALSTLMEGGFSEEKIETFKVPGAYEIPIVAKRAAQTGRFSAILTLGCVIKGETAHFEYISDAVSNALQQVAIGENIPVIFGILTTYTTEQALVRTSSPHDKGKEVAQALLDLLKLDLFKQSLPNKISSLRRE